MIVGYNPLKWRPFSLNAGIFRLIFCSIFRIKPDWKRNAAIRTRGKPPTNPIGLLFLLAFVESNWFGGLLSGPKRPIFRHTAYIFLTVALLRPTKIRFVWQKMASFLSQTRPR
jgi:hypothetical protein